MQAALVFPAWQEGWDPAFSQRNRKTFTGSHVRVVPSLKEGEGKTSVLLMFIWKGTSHSSSLFRLHQAHFQRQCIGFFLGLLVVAVFRYLSSVICLLLSNWLCSFSEDKPLGCLGMQVANIICKQLVFCRWYCCLSSAESLSLFWRIGFYRLTIYKNQLKKNYL